ncbi:hypothetical protein [Ramlibacter sp. AN1133]|uniref:hypothetical protein n=1 Tax=Ramlibacter sp. AN1133 TaxID=3133429 RepID=UPI0030BD6752
MNSVTNHIFYAAATTAPGAAGELLSVALMQTKGPWFYAEVVDACAALTGEQRAGLKLRCVPRTRFVRRDQLAMEVAAWLARVAAGPLVIRVETDATRRLMAPLLESASQVAEEKVSATWRICRFSNASLQDFYERSGEFPPGIHSLVDAVGLTVCDLDRHEKMDLEQIHHLELVMGTKGALGFRAWGRRHEARNTRLPHLPSSPAFA